MALWRCRPFISFDLEANIMTHVPLHIWMATHRGGERVTRIKESDGKGGKRKGMEKGNEGKKAGGNPPACVKRGHSVTAALWAVESAIQSRDLNGVFSDLAKRDTYERLSIFPSHSIDLPPPNRGSRPGLGIA